MKKVSAALFAALLAASLSAEPVPVDGVAAWVEGKAITVMDVLREAQPQFGALYQEKGLTRAELNARRMAIYQKARQALVDNELIYAWYLKQQQAASAGITDQMVESRIDDIVRDEFDGSRERLMKALAEERQTYEEWRERMTRRIIIQGLRQREVLAKIQITPQAVENYYHDNKARYQHPGEVLLRRIVVTGPDAEMRSRVLMDRLAAGEDFAAVVKTESGGKDASGGLWGWRAEEDLSPALREKVRMMRVKGVARVDLDGDWYIVKLEGRDEVPLRDARNAIEDILRQREVELLTDIWRDKLEREFHVKLIDQSLWDE